MSQDQHDLATPKGRATLLVRGFIDLLITSCSNELREELLKLRP